MRSEPCRRRRDSSEPHGSQSSCTTTACANETNATLGCASATSTRGRAAGRGSSAASKRKGKIRRGASGVSLAASSRARPYDGIDGALRSMYSTTKASSPGTKAASIISMLMASAALNRWPRAYNTWLARERCTLVSACTRRGAAPAPTPAVSGTRHTCTVRVLRASTRQHMSSSGAPTASDVMAYSARMAFVPPPNQRASRPRDSLSSAGTIWCSPRCMCTRTANNRAWVVPTITWLPSMRAAADTSSPACSGRRTPVTLLDVVKASLTAFQNASCPSVVHSSRAGSALAFRGRGRRRQCGGLCVGGTGNV